MKKLIILLVLIPFISLAQDTTVRGKGTERCSHYVLDYNEFTRLLNNDPNVPAFFIMSERMQTWVQSYYGVVTGMSDVANTVFNRLNSQTMTASEQDTIVFQKMRELVVKIDPRGEELMYELNHYCKQNPTDMFYSAIIDNLMSYM